MYEGKLLDTVILRINKMEFHFTDVKIKDNFITCYDRITTQYFDNLPL
jgi:hypothetical protein